MPARFDDLPASRALVFDDAPLEILVAWRADEVRSVLSRVDDAAAAGHWVYGMVGYEAAAGLDPYLRIRAGAGDGLPLVWFAVCGPPRVEAPVAPPVGERRSWSAPWRLDLTEDAHADAVRRIHDDIAAGSYYQANLTARLHGSVLGDLDDYYAGLVHAQGGAFNAFVEVGDQTIVSASPELFFEWSPNTLRCRPMKGTAPRAAGPAQDIANRDRLRRSAKDAAENVMIVDLLRNDLGRIARTGSVRVSSLLDVERYGSVWQLTSEITATPRPELTVLEAFTAMFPCGSVTGAPKGAAMAAIADLETKPRGVYCGSVGWVAPADQPMRARFNVAIRTVTVSRENGSAVYGSGGGITIGSEPAAEYRELLDKTAVLTSAAGEEPLLLLETFGYDPGSGFRNLDRHLARLARSARTFEFPFDEARVRDTLDDAIHGSLEQALRISLRLAADGGATAAVTRLDQRSTELLRLALDDRPVDAELIWLRHKTNRRAVYEQARSRHPDADDVVLVNTRGEVTETTIANIAVRLGQRWYTPPVESGCLPGVGRELALEQGRISERTMTADDLVGADELAVISSLRGWRPGALVESARSS